MYDVVIVGGSYAGLSGAMQLARARRRVLVVDSGLPRNRFARAGHGILWQDGKAPQAMLEEARQQVLAYPSAELRIGEAVEAKKQNGKFLVALKDGSECEAVRLLLATGMRDELPQIPGLEDRWGVSVVHCPYCHGYEVADRNLGVLATHPLSVHQAGLLPDWGPTTFFTQGEFEPESAQAVHLVSRGVRIERSPIVEVLGTGQEMEAVRLRDGRVVEIGALFLAPRTHLASPLAEQLGCDLERGHTGPYVRVDEWKQTSVPGVYAAGDAASPMHNATLAVTAGGLAGVGIHQAIATEPLPPAAGARDPPEQRGRAS